MKTDPLRQTAGGELEQPKRRLSGFRLPVNATFVDNIRRQFESEMFAHISELRQLRAARRVGP